MSVASNMLLIVLKLVAGLMSGSVSIISEAIHSMMDLLAAVIAFVITVLLTRATPSTVVGDSDRMIQQVGITGILCHGGDIFMQVLEGGRDTVNHLYSRICSDPRHRDVIVLHYEEITERRFSSWTMGQVNLERVNPSILLIT